MSNSNQLDIIRMVTEVARQEIHTQLGEVLKLLNEDIEEGFNVLNGRLNELLVRIEALENTPVREPTEGKEI